MSRRKKLFIIISSCVLLAMLIAAGACSARYASLSRLLVSQRAAESFAGESGLRVSQESAFFPIGKETDISGVRDFLTKLDGKLAEASLEQPETGSLYDFAYSAATTLNVTGSRGSAQVPVTGVGGDFFLFHPLYLRSGSYISEDDLMHDRVVLEYELAWRLFGSTDISGLEVTINGAPYKIAGVVYREDDFANDKAHTGDPGMYMSYDAMYALGETGISCFELVSRDPVSGYVKSVLDEGFPDAVTVENSTRFGLGAIFGVLGDFGERSMNVKGVIYPYWENAARLIEDHLALLLVFILPCAALPALAALIIAIIYLRRLIRRGAAKAPELRERLRERRYYGKLGGKNAEMTEKEASGSGKRDAEEYTQGV